MVITSLIIALASRSMLTDPGSGSEPKLSKTRLPPISTITIRNSGSKSTVAEDSGEQCADFKLNYQEIREYLGSAAEVAEHDYFHMLDWSPCYASGEVAFKNGITGNWTIQQYRAGALKLSNGRTLYLYCPECQARAFPAVDR